MPGTEQYAGTLKGVAMFALDSYYEIKDSPESDDDEEAAYYSGRMAACASVLRLITGVDVQTFEGKEHELREAVRVMQ